MMPDHTKRSFAFGRARVRRLGFGFGALVGALLTPFACSVPGAFTCTSDEACGPGGQCEDNGYCSFGDDECPSGRRYGAFAGDSVAGMCVGGDLGDGDTQGDGDGDGDGDSGDGDGDSGDGDGDTGDGDGDGDSGDGDGDGDMGVELYLYTFRVSDPSWTRMPLAITLNDPNAPNDVDILAATKLTHFSRLLLLGADGLLYIRKNSAFDPPVDLLSWASNELAGVEIGAMSHVPKINDESCEDIYFYVQAPDPPTKQVVYEYCDDDSVTLVGKTDLPGFAQFPQSAQAIRFAFADALPDLYPQSSWLKTYRAIDDELGRFDGVSMGSLFADYPLEKNPFWGTGPGGRPLVNEPDPTTVRAAYFTSGLGDSVFLFVIAP